MDANRLTPKQPKPQSGRIFRLIGRSRFLTGSDLAGAVAVMAALLFATTAVHATTVLTMDLQALASGTASNGTVFTTSSAFTISNGGQTVTISPSQSSGAVLVMGLFVNFPTRADRSIQSRVRLSAPNQPGTLPTRP